MGGKRKSENSTAVDDFTAHPRQTDSGSTATGGARISEHDPVFVHLPVMLSECIDALEISPDGIYVDGTAGGGGHSEAIAKRLTGKGRLVSIDRDGDAIEACRRLTDAYGDRVTLVRDNYRNLASILSGLGIEKINGALFDLGVSSHQIDSKERGFSYSHDGDAPLDMRMSRDDMLTAYDVVNGYDKETLRRIISEYGEERFAGRIADRIAEARERSPIRTTGELSAIVTSAVPAATVPAGSHPAKRTFQAIRIEVNGELDGIEPALRAAADAMAPGGRLAVITFHSLEDRIVKRVFSELARGCICPPDFPVCVCGRTPSVRLIGKKPATAGADELSANPRARSAKLRVAEKL